MLIENPESWIGIDIDGYRLVEKLGHGKIGYVFLAENLQVPSLKRACKIIKSDSLKTGWELEIRKVSLLDSVPEVVDIQNFGTIPHNGQSFTYINYKYIEGKNLKEYVEKEELSISFLVALGEALVATKHACDDRQVLHGDLHEGNILIAKPDSRLPGNQVRIYVTDFGCGGSHNQLTPRPDAQQISSIMCNLLRSVRADKLEATERSIRDKLINFFSKEFTDSYGMQSSNSGIGISSSLWALFKDRCREAHIEAANAGRGRVETNVDDYLNAEALGHRQDEWQNLFVPEILGASAFTSRNVTVITGARGCGKTMAFRRLTLFLDELIGSSSGVPGADGVLGFYLNCRDIVEAFPFIPPRLSEGARRQLVHYFHLCWLQEILRAFIQRNLREITDYAWLYDWLEQKFVGSFKRSLLVDVDPLIFITNFIGTQKELCRTTQFKKLAHWEFEQIDLLDEFYDVASKNIPWINGKPFFFFLDDYTIPLLNSALQATLNPIIFKRRANVFFKVSTEASNSFLRMNGKKPLEATHDFDLIDLANETLHIEYDERAKLLDSIFQRRIKRIEEFRDLELGLEDVLGASDWSYNEQARRLRVAKKQNPGPIYYGSKAFISMWSSDVRSMVQLFNELMRSMKVKDPKFLPIPQADQQGRYSESGGEFLNLTETIRDTGFWDEEAKLGTTSKSFGKRLREIVQAFIAITRWELVEQPLIQNQGAENPKQAFRIEIIDSLELNDRTQLYYNGLLRWHVFLPDWRGRSLRGNMTPRIFLNQRLIPYARLSFSKKDSISLTNREFQHLLSEPRQFEKYWKDKKRSSGKLKQSEDNLQGSLGFELGIEEGEKK